MRKGLRRLSLYNSIIKIKQLHSKESAQWVLGKLVVCYIQEQRVTIDALNSY